MTRTLEEIPMPEVALSDDGKTLLAAIKARALSPEILTEVVIYCGREQAKVAAVLDEISAAARDRLVKYYAGLKKSERATVRTEAGMTTYSEEGFKRDLKDRDTTVAALTPEQLRATYKPDMKALEVILKPAVFERLTKKVKVPAKISVRDSKGDFEELGETPPETDTDA